MGRRVGVGGLGGRRGMDRRAAYSVFATPVLGRRERHVGHQPGALHSAPEGDVVARACPEERERHGITAGTPLRAGAGHPVAPGRVRALHGSAFGVCRAQPAGQSVQRRVAGLRVGRARREDRSRKQPDTRRDGQPGFRPGRGGSGRGESDGCTKRFSTKSDGSSSRARTFSGTSAPAARTISSASTHPIPTSSTRVESGGRRDSRPPAILSRPRGPRRSSGPSK